MNEPLLSIRNLQKSYSDHEVLKDISITVYPRDVIAVIGSSGSGKSTFLRCINRLEDIGGGRIDFRNGESVCRIDNRLSEDVKVLRTAYKRRMKGADKRQKKALAEERDAEIEKMRRTLNLNEIRAKIGMVFQNFYLFNHLNVLRNCTIAQEKSPASFRQRSQRKSRLQPDQSRHGGSPLFPRR